MAEDLVNKHKVCLGCGKISGPGITSCHGCGSKGFRPLTEKETNERREVYQLAGRSLLESTYDPSKIEIIATNVFVV